MLFLDVLFKIGNFEVSTPILISFILIIVVIVAFILYRLNHRTQTRASQYMDNECSIFNKLGLVRYIKERGKHISNPTLVVVEIRNLLMLYTSCENRGQIVYQISDLLVHGLGKNETIARIEFNKFAILFENHSRDQIKEYAQKVCESLDSMRIENYGTYNFYIYFGIYENAPLQDYEYVVDYAAAIIRFSSIVDNNLYYYSSEVKSQMEKLARMNQEKDMDFEQKRFVPYIQPKVSLKTGEVLGGEMLVRWLDENHNIKYMPEEFIQLFEENGFITKIDDLMLHEACKLVQTLAMRGKNDVIISVNISKVKFMSANFEQSMIAIVRQYQINPKNIEIEITETAVMENFQYISNCVMALRQFGFIVAMDDFGKAYSSLGMLSSNPFDAIKLDMVFFRNKLVTDKDRVIVKNILDMLSKLDCEIVCEGIQDRQTLDTLATINQDVIIQGYCISQPIPVPQFESFLATKFEFNYAPIEPETPPAPPAPVVTAPAPVEPETPAPIVEVVTGPRNIAQESNVPAPIIPDHSAEIEEMQRQMLELQHQLQAQIEEQERRERDAEVNRLKAEIEQLKNPVQKSDPKDDEIAALKAEIEKLKNPPKDNSSEMEALRREIERLKDPERKENIAEINALKLEIERLKLVHENDKTYHNIDQLNAMRREIDDLRYRGRDRDYDRGGYNARYDYRDREIENLQQQIRELRENQNKQPQIDVEKLIDRLSQSQNESRSQLERIQNEKMDLKEKLEKERREKEELESLLNELKNKDNDDLSDVDQEKELEKANSRLNLDLSTLDNFHDDDDDEEEEEDEDFDEPSKLSKPNLTLAELEAIIQSYKDKYKDNWNEHAKDELKGGYYELLDNLQYYKKHEKKTFLERIKQASPELKQLFNIVKNEIMSYNGVANKLTNSYDCFYMGRNLAAKLSLTTKKVRVYLAVDPNQYPERLYPHRDVSSKKSHLRTPYYTMVKSQLSVKRINKVIADMMANNNLQKNPDYKPIDYAMKYRFLKSSTK